MSEFLEVHRGNAQAAIDASLGPAVDGSLSYADLLEFCEHFRVSGIASLLLEANPEALHIGLHDGARAFGHGLAHVDRQQIILSQATPLFDAIACGGAVLAAEIAASLGVEWQSEVEYQDDYLYYSVIRQWALARAFDDDVGKAVDSLAAVAAGDDPRLLVCQALRARDASEFGDALAVLLARHEHRYQMLVERARLSDGIAATLPYLCVEGLAWVRIAEASALGLEEGYPLVPSIARGDFTAAFNASAWRRRA